MDGHEITELNLSSLERTKRIDAEFYKKEHIAVDKVLYSWNKKSIADCFYVSDGNHMSISDSFCEIGVPYYRGQDIYNLFIENASPLMIDRTTFDKPQMRRSHLQKGDILMSIVGAIVGNSAMVTSENPATCSCKLSIMRSKDNGISPELLLIYIKNKSTFIANNDVIFASMGVGSLGKVSLFSYDGNKQFVTDSTLRIYRAKKTARVLPEVLCVFLQSTIGQELIYRYVVGSTGIINIYDDDIAKIPIPVLDSKLQKDIATKVQESFNLRRQSKQLLEYAKQAVEMAIEQGEDIAMVWLESKVGQ